MRAVTLSLVFCLAPASFAQAQSDWESVKTLPHHATVRVKGLTGPRQVRGQLESVDDAQLTVIANGKPLVMSRQAVRQLDIATGRRRVKKQALMGLGIGAALGALLGWIAGAEIDDKARARDVLIWAGVGTAVGIIKGLIDRQYAVVYRNSGP